MMVKKIYLKLFILNFLFVFLQSFSWAEISMRRTMLLPIQDSVGGAIGFKVFEEVEGFLKDSDRFYYRPNSEMINILNNYRNNLSSHLNNPEVLKVIAKKINAGSLIKIKLESLVNGTDIEFQVVGENGEDIYYKNKTRISKDDIKLMSQVIVNWLNEYDKIIPYNGTIIGVLGKQFTIDMGKQSGLRVGDHLIIRRPLKKKRHPLLKEVVEWETEIMARAKVVALSEQQGTGLITDLKNTKRIGPEDWIIIDNNSNLKGEREESTSDNILAERNGHEFGKLGVLTFQLDIGNGESANSFRAQNRTISGWVFGPYGMIETWITRNYWGSFELGKKFGSYKKKQGDISQESNFINMGVYKLKGGYKFLPLGFFYGPHLDAYLGYGRYSYNLDLLSNDGFGEVSFSGILLGVKGGIPLLKLFRLSLKMDFLFNPTYSEESSIYGKSDSTASYQFELGGTYFLTTQMSLESSLQLTSNKAKFGQSSQFIRFKDTSMKTGLSFTF